LGFTPPCGVTNVTGQCGCDNVTNMSGPSSATPQGSQSDSQSSLLRCLDKCSPDEVSRDEVSPYLLTTSSLYKWHFINLFILLYLMCI